MAFDLRRHGPIAAALVLGAMFVVYAVTRPETTHERLRYEPPPPADPAPPRAPDAIAGRTYVSAYSHAYLGDGQPVLFAVTLTVRNVDATHAMVLRRVDYHATGGARVREMLPEARVLPPLGTIELFVERSDESGGSGANFIVEWEIEPGAQRPVAEAVMLGSASAVGYSFAMRGVDVSDPPPPPTVEAPAIEAPPVEAPIDVPALAPTEAAIAP